MSGPGQSAIATNQYALYPCTTPFCVILLLFQNVCTYKQMSNDACPKPNMSSLVINPVDAEIVISSEINFEK